MGSYIYLRFLKYYYLIILSIYALFYNGPTWDEIDVLIYYIFLIYWILIYIFYCILHDLIITCSFDYVS